MGSNPQPYDIDLVHVPAGAFWMGDDPVPGEEDGYLGQPRHRVHLPEYWIGRTPVTNAQYLPFVRATGCHMPDHWGNGQALPGLEQHPVTFVSWDDARAYCGWVEGQFRVASCGLRIWRDGQPLPLDAQPGMLSVRLPTEAEWERAARGAEGRAYPWGDAWDAARCNTEESGWGATTAVGAFPQGASPYGALDMAGNVWEWTSSARAPYPYDAADGREEAATGEGTRREDVIDPHAGARADPMRRIVRGGSFLLDRRYARCAVRYGSVPERRTWVYGFRVCVAAQAE
jgi:formylglycine-generating enzyme required for sulfatase activity